MDHELGFRRLLLFRHHGGGYCVSVIVLDGMRLSSDYAGELESLVRARDLAGVEVYRGIQAPAEFADLRGVRHGRLLDQAAQRERPGGR